MADMSEEELILAVFEGRPRDRIPFNIRHEYWYFVNKAKGSLPKEYEGLDLPEICSMWGASWRCYSGYYVESCVNVVYEDVNIVRKEYDRRAKIVIETPVGKLESLIGFDSWGLSSQILEYPIKTVGDIKVLEYVLDSVKVSFSREAYERLRRRVGGRGIVSYFFPRSPLQALFYNYLGIFRTFKFLIRYKAEVEGLMEVIKRHNHKFFEVIGSSPIRVLNLGENIDARITSPRLFEKYCLPYYQEAADYLHRRGKYVHIHVDGYAKPLLPLLRETGLDGIEALTPKPAGDVTLEDIRKAVGDDMVLIDGVPYLYLLPEVSVRELEEFVKRIIMMFPHNLILGISDEVPPPSDVRRLKLISMIIEGFLARS